MSEPQAAQNPRQEVPPSALPVSGVLPDLFATGDAVDDAPTIISKNGPQPARVEDTLTSTLRGRTLAHFELLEPIGVGGMAAVIRARDLQLDRSVALKILPPEMANDPENVRRFHQEARAAARLDHENIARVFYCGEDQRLHFIAFEFVEGENLRVLLERRGRLPVPEAIHYMLQVATGLAHASARGVVHRDIKPSNIIISATGRAKLVDMGLARSLEPHGDNGLTQSGVTLGTFDYISPEQALEPRDADVRSDLYSMGCTFYHMLTGQAPVPEGTAARKLHHHQHIAPLDPRQLNPEIPDDVAAILARMMAKDPKDRYQRAEHLVQHLIQVAQKLGAVSEAPDGVLFMDAPLPSPPGKRPVLVVSLAFLALAGLLAVLSLAPTESNSGDLIREQAGQDEGNQELPKRDKALDKKKPQKVNQQNQVVVHSFQELAAAARNPRVRRILLGMPTLSLLSGEDGVGPGHAPKLVFQRQGPELVIESQHPNKPCIIQVGYATTDDMDPQPWMGLTVQGGSVRFQNIRFELKGMPPSDLQGKVALAALGLSGGSLKLTRCTFHHPNCIPPQQTQAMALFPTIQVAMVAVSEAARHRPELSLDRCYFENGQNAVSLAGNARILADNCSFGRHNVLFYFRGKSHLTRTDLHMSHCSAFGDKGSNQVFRLDNRAGCSFVVRHSIFSNPNSSPSSALILQTASSADPGEDVRYAGEGNCYHNLNSLWIHYQKDAGAADFSNSLADFLAELKKTRGQDEQSEMLDPAINPWEKSNPLEPSLSQGEAFRLKNLPQLWQHNADQMIGVLDGVQGPLYPELRTRPKKTGPLVKKGPRLKTVNPDADDTSIGTGTYRSLEAAVAEAYPGDEIQIQFTGEMKIPPIRLNRIKDKADVSLVIKAAQGYFPVLVLEGTRERKASLFQLHDGQVLFEGMEFRLDPNGPDEETRFQFLTGVDVTGNGRCTFKQCVLTFVEGKKAEDDKAVKPVRPSGIQVTYRPGEVMKMTPLATRPAPELRFQDCFVRGQGDVVMVGPSRPLNLEVSNALIALDGSLLHVDGTGKVSSLSSTDPSNQVVKLTNVTTFLSKPLLYLAKDGNSLLPTCVKDADNNLFVAAADAADNKPPLIRFDQPESENQMLRLIQWNGTNNTYVNFKTMLESPRISPIEPERWPDFEKKFTDDGHRFAKIKFKLEKGLALSELEPNDFEPLKTSKAMDLQKSGANLDSLPRVPSKRVQEEKLKEEDEKPTDEAEE
jgi:serine/threonine protein kinase